MARARKTDAVLDAAEHLFEAGGFEATGVNQITAQAGVASMTLYNNFRNKQELIVATIDRRARRMHEAFRSAMQGTDGHPARAILALFDGLDDWISTEAGAKDGFAGCYFVKASVEFSALDHPAHQAAARAKQNIVSLFREAAEQLGHEDPHALALDLHLLFEGAITQAVVFADPDSGKRARKLAGHLLVPATTA